MGFPGNQPEMLQLRDHITFSKIVVRGWYMPHFDRRDLLNSEKQVWGGFRNLPDLCEPICGISRFFAEKVIFLTLESEKNDRKLIFFKFF